MSLSGKKKDSSQFITWTVNPQIEIDKTILIIRYFQKYGNSPNKGYSIVNNCESLCFVYT